MQPLGWSDLSKKQQDSFGNGCGPAKLFGVPQFIFIASCRQHDFYYWRGGSEYDRKVADWFFYAYMLEDIQKHHRNRMLYRICAYLYFRCVRIFGWMMFAHGRYKTKQEFIDYTRTR